MPDQLTRDSSPHDDAGSLALLNDDLARYAEAARLLGCLEGLSGTDLGPGEVHAALMKGLPGSALQRLLGNLHVLSGSGARLAAAIGVSLRTVQRKKDDVSKRLTVEQAGRLWQFAEVLARATRVLGSQDAAERWLAHPAIGLNQRCPVDLLATPTGAKMVTDYLGRIQYGVYTRLLCRRRLASRHLSPGGWTRRSTGKPGIAASARLASAADGTQLGSRRSTVPSIPPPPSSKSRSMSGLPTSTRFPGC